MATRRRHFEGALGGLLPLDVLEVERARRHLLEARLGRREHLAALEMIDEGEEVARRQDLEPAGPGRLAA